MNIEKNRLSTFYKWPIGAPASPVTLAKAGFYVVEQPLTVKCFACELTISCWDDNNVIAIEHELFSPFCPFILDPFTSGNVATTEEVHPAVETSTAVLGLPAFSNDTLVSSQIQPITLSDKLASVVGRLETFKNWPKPHIVSPQNLAEAGLFYLKVGDKTECFYCKGIMMQWSVGDNPDLEHSSIFPDCPFVTSVILPKLTQRGDSLTRQLKFEYFSIVGNENLDDLGVFEHKAPRKPEYFTVASRLSTFSSWPHDRMHIAKMLAQAGCFYRDCDERIVCFHCNGFLNSWNLEGDPWVEHARCHPSCYFVKLMKGQEFIKSCIAMRPKDETDDKSAFNIQNQDGTDTSIGIVQTQRRVITRSMVSAALESMKGNQQPAPVTAGKYDSKAISKQHHDVTKAEVKNLKKPKSFFKDAMLCKVCFDSKVRIVFLPCSHLATCANCAPSLKECPICRSIIKLTLRVSLL